MGEAAVKVYKSDSGSLDVYRSTAGMDIASFDTAAALGNYADMMKYNTVIAVEVTLVHQAVLPVSLPGDENY